LCAQTECAAIHGRAEFVTDLEAYGRAEPCADVRTVGCSHYEADVEPYRAWHGILL
jgi:hypothetical protein